MTNFKRISLVIAMLFAIEASCERSKDKIYYNFDSAGSCFVTLNGTHQFGCTTPSRGSVGVLHVIQNEDDLTWLLQKGQAVPYMIVLTPSMFKRDVMMQIKASGKVNGVFLANDPSKASPPSFTHEDTCPNRYSGLSSLSTQTCGSDLYPSWNPNGSGLLLQNWGMPIFYTNNATHLDELIKCAKTYNTKYSSEDQPKHTLCALQMSSHMFAAVDSRKCMQRRRDTLFTQVVYCDPLGGQNVWYTLFPRKKVENHPEESRSVIVVAARMDSTSMFDGVVPGAVSPVTGLVALLATARLLSKMIPDKSTVSEKNVLFTIFDGESYDYIGSSRMVYDIQQGVFPVEQLNDSSVTQPPLLSLEHIGLFVELGHLAKPSSSLFAHLNKLSDRSYQTQWGSYSHAMGKDFTVIITAGLPSWTPKSDVIFMFTPKCLFASFDYVLSQVTKYDYLPSILQHVQGEIKVIHAVELLTQEALKVGLNISALPQTLRLPPASAQSFIKADNNIPTIILADFNSSFSYEYHHSVLDDKKTLQYKYANGSKIEQNSIQQYLANISSMLARTLYKTVMNADYTGSETVELDLVDELLYCYLESANCTIFNAVMGQEVALNKPTPLYVSVYSGSSPTNLVTGATLAMLTGSPTEFGKSQCQSNKTVDQVYKYMWVNPDWRDSNHTSVCIRSTMNFSIALSPAFDIENYDMTSGTYSTWTESRWQEYSVRMFLKPPLSHDVKVVTVGSLVMLFSFVFVFFVKSRSEILFSSGVSVP